MLKTKVILLTCVCVLAVSFLNGQSYINAYYISLQGDTISGTALLNAYADMGKAISFKSQTGEKMTLKPETVRAVWLSPDRFFESQTIHFRNAKDELNGAYFLRYLLKTDSVTLMGFESDNYEGLYIQKKGEKIAALQVLNDFVTQEMEGDKKKQVIRTDTLSNADQVNTFGSIGEYKTRKPYLLLLYKTFNACDITILDGAYILVEKDIKKAFRQLAKCAGKQNEIVSYFKESSWKSSVGLTLGSQTSSKNFSYVSPLSVGIYLNYGNLKNGVSVGVNWLNVTPKATALSASKGAFSEYFLTYNRKLFLREKINFGMVFGASFLKNHGLLIEKDSQGNPLYAAASPYEETIYSIFGVSGAYQFVKNNYLNVQYLRNIRNILQSGTYFDRVQIQYEYRF